MKVEIWADLICPWCGLGQHRLERALADFAHREHVQLVHRSFQLDPRAPETAIPVREMLTKKYGMTEAQLTASVARIEGLAAADGLAPYHVGDNVVGNTSLAHELLALATERGFGARAWQHLYRAYFGERRSIFDIDALAELGVELGIDPIDARAALADRRYREKVLSEGRDAQALGSTGVPFVVIDRHYAIAGAQPTATFREVIERAWREQPSRVVA